MAELRRELQKRGQYKQPVQSTAFINVKQARTIMFGTKRLKKKSQSVDISGPGCNPVAAEAQTPQPSRPVPAPQTAAPEEEQDSSTNSQRRNPRRSDLKRYYTIEKDRWEMELPTLPQRIQMLLGHICRV
ncbi:oxidation resistance protein 1-like [Geothlypis trichas]